MTPTAAPETTPETTSDSVAIVSRSAPLTRTHAPPIDDDVVLASLSTQTAVLDSSGIVVRVNDAWRAAMAVRLVDEERSSIGRSYLDECRRAEARGFETAREIRQGVEAVLGRRMRAFRYEFRAASDDRWYEMIVDALKG